jgi:hypothetical protein
MSLIKKDSKFDLDKKRGPEFDRPFKNSIIKGLFENGKKYFSSVHSRFYGPQGKGPETKRTSNNPRKYLDTVNSTIAFREIGEGPKPGTIIK